MTDFLSTSNQIHYVTTFQDLVSTPFTGDINAICWRRELTGDFSEIVKQVALTENIATLTEDQLLTLQLTAQGQLARDFLITDLKRLTDHGALPTLNVIKQYQRDDAFPLCPTDVYSFHVDRSPIPTDTFLCTYYGAPSDILPNAQGQQKVLIPDIRTALKTLYDGPEAGFEAFLQEYSFDLHYQALPHAQPISLGIGHLWRLAIDHPESEVPPCLHRAPKETDGECRLLLIC